jgi:excisionase family DNA binding protein
MADKLVVSPDEAFKMLDIGVSKGYALLHSGEIESFRDGNRRKIPVESIHRYLERRKEGRFEPIREAPRPLTVPVKRGRGRPRKDQQ